MARSRKRRLSGEARRALELLGDAGGVTTKAQMLTHGFTDRMLSLLDHAGLIKMRHEMINTGTKTIVVGRVMITVVGLRALEGEGVRGSLPRLLEVR